MKIALLKNADRYGLPGVPCGIIEPSATINPDKSSFFIGDGGCVDVDNTDLIDISVSEAQIESLFPLCF